MPYGNVSDGRSEFVKGNISSYYPYLYERRHKRYFNQVVLGLALTNETVVDINWFGQSYDNFSGATTNGRRRYEYFIRLKTVSII